MAMSKSDKVRMNIEKGNLKEALALCKSFRIWDSPNDKDVVQLAWDCMTNESFYAQMGYDTPSTIEAGINAMKRIYGTGV